MEQILQRDGYIIYISGAKEKGKTDFGLFLAEFSHINKYRTKISTNIETESYMIEKQITNLPDLKDWLQEKGKKLFILDEAGLSIPKLRFMSSMNIEIMKILQMIRHYDAGFIGIAPSTKNIDSTFMNTDILDAHIKKITKRVAKVKDYLQNDTYFLEDIPKTTINFNSKHIAEFKMERTLILSELPLCCQVAASYSSTGNMGQVATAFKLEKMQIQRLIRKHCQHTLVTRNEHPEGIDRHESLPEP